MSEPSRRIFLSYRREDCRLHARLLADNLRDRLGYRVFLDDDTIGLGQNFAQTIEREIDECDLVLVMIGDDWLTLLGGEGGPRIFDPQDWIYREIRQALERGRQIVPVLVEGAEMPRQDQLPDELRVLAQIQGAHLRDVSWPADFQRLAARLPAPRERGPEPPWPVVTMDRIDTVIVAAGKAYPDYLATSSYICQARRSFRTAGMRFLGFYAGREIKQEIASIHHRRDNVMFDLERARSSAPRSAVRSGDRGAHRSVSGRPGRLALPSGGRRALPGLPALRAG